MSSDVTMTKQAAQKKVGRPRDEHATEAILRSAVELATESGLDALTVDRIAARAGVGKATIYRRWPDVWAVVVEALLAEITQISPVLQRGTARKSFALSMKLVAKSFRGKLGTFVRLLIGRAQVDNHLRLAISERWLGERRKLAGQLVLRGIAADDLRKGLDPDVALDALYGALYHRLLIPYGGTKVNLPDAYVDSLIDVVFGGIGVK
jgi:AcrR family transcriptional regulator